MLGSRDSTRNSTPSDSLSWQSFARDEGKRSAEQFLDRLREFKENNDDTPESMCVREFAMVLTESLAGHLDRCTSPSRSGFKPLKSKHWWNIFKRGKSTRRKSSRDVSSSYEHTRQIILDRTVAQMNLQDGYVGEWIKCRLVLVGFQDNYQIEVYCPPKVSHNSFSAHQIFRQVDVLVICVCRKLAVASICCDNACMDLTSPVSA